MANPGTIIHVSRLHSALQYAVERLGGENVEEGQTFGDPRPCLHLDRSCPHIYGVWIEPLIPTVSWNVGIWLVACQVTNDAFRCYVPAA